jgi:hypothetical protein
MVLSRTYSTASEGAIVDAGCQRGCFLTIPSSSSSHLASPPAVLVEVRTLVLTSARHAALAPFNQKPVRHRFISSNYLQKYAYTEPSFFPDWRVGHVVTAVDMRSAFTNQRARAQLDLRLPTRLRPPGDSSQPATSMADDLTHLLPPSWKKHVQLWLEDDIPSYDIGGFVVGGACLAPRRVL